MTPESPPERAGARRTYAVYGGAVIAAVIAVIVGVIATRPDASVASEPAKAPETREPSIVPTTPEPSLPSDAPIAGWLIDTAGAPIADVQVTVRDPEGTFPDEKVASDQDGAFRFESSGDRTLLLDAPHVFEAEVRWRKDAPLPRILLTRRVSLDARVMDQGKPVEGAEVSLTDGSAPTLATAITDAQGLAHFDDLQPGPYEVWARRETRVSPLVRVIHEGSVDPPPVALALEDGGRVHGTVSADAPLAGATVLLAPVELDHAVRLATLDAHGAFAIDGVPRGAWRIDAEAPGYLRGAATVEVRDADAEANLTLRRAGVVTGLVVDERGTPVRNATLVLRSQEEKTSQAEVVPVERRHDAPLRWVHPLAGPLRQMPFRDSRRFGAARAGGRPAECGRGHCGVDLGSTRGVTVHAAADGVVALVYTEIRREAGRYVAIDHEGGIRTFYMHLDDIRADLEIGQPIRAGDPIGTVGRTGVIKNAPHLHFAIAQERLGRSWYLDPEPILRHAVVLPTARSLDAPLAQATMIATLRRDGAAPAQASPARFTTDAHGVFRLDGVAPGEYVAAAFHADLAPGASDPFDVVEGKTTEGVKIVLTPGVIVHGRVLGRLGAVHGARVLAEEGFGETSHKVATAFTDEAGEFELRSLTGKLTLVVQAAGFGDVERTVVLDEKRESRHREDFELTTEDASLRGEVTDPDGHAAAGVAVRVVEGPTQRRRTITDAQGRFTLDRLASGGYTVELSSPEYPPARASMKTDTYKTLRVNLGGSLTIDLRDAHTGAPLAAVRIDAHGPEDRDLRPMTGADGVATLRGLEPGRWRLRARVTGYVAAEQTVDVSAGRTPKQVKLELRRGAILAGVVRDRYGRRVAGARVTAGDAEARTNADGEFRLTDVPTGAVELTAELDGARGAQSLQLSPGDEIVTLKIDLAEP
jgi:murein DD-endopeptidase MepM/ murein hydrolase activator NlpD